MKRTPLPVVFVLLAVGCVPMRMSRPAQVTTTERDVAPIDRLGRWDGARFERFAPADQLSSDNVWAIFEDQSGQLWFGTDRGVSRWDGRGWHHLDLAGRLGCDWVFSMYQDRRGHIWFCVYGGGICRWDGLVIQTVGEKDRRQRLLTLSEEGEAFENALSAEQRRRLREAYTNAGPDAVAGFRTVLHEMMNDGTRNLMADAQDRE